VLHTWGWRGARALRPSDGLNARFPVFTQLNPPLPVLVTDKGAGLAFAVIDYGVEHNLIWVTALDGSGEIWCAPNPKVRLQANWSMGRTKDTSLQFVPEGVSSQ
jgi:hypothetical protein